MNVDIIEDKYKLNPDLWVSHPKIKKDNSTRKYLLTITFIIIGLLLVSMIKNETRKLQNEINELQSSLNKIKGTLREATLDHQVITSPENISELANKYLDTSFTFYKRSQIKQLKEKENLLVKVGKVKHKNTFEKKGARLSDKVKLQVAKKIESTKTELKKLQEFYSEPKKLPERVTFKLAKKIDEKRTELQKIYSTPKEEIKLDKVRKWAAVQVVKAFFGIPAIPGK